MTFPQVLAGEESGLFRDGEENTRVTPVTKSKQHLLE